MRQCLGDFQLNAAHYIDDSYLCSSYLSGNVGTPSIYDGGHVVESSCLAGRSVAKERADETILLSHSYEV
jgi:hypothetical protein